MKSKPKTVYSNPGFPYWTVAPGYELPPEDKPVTRSQIVAWSHPAQQGSNPRPDGFEIHRRLRSEFLILKTIGLVTLTYYRNNPRKKPDEFRNIRMIGLRHVVLGPYAGRLFAPYLNTNNELGWMDLFSGMTCLDKFPLHR
ncbi:hypothetical protein H7X65_03800 [Candidatus Parcubacteria bacterium]|nr:hypothetical protein [Candidatus Parcubacteria bacterium]